MGALFARCIALVTDIRIQNTWLIYLLPFGGIVSVGVYRLFKVSQMGTDQVIKSMTGKSEITPFITPAVFFGATVSHLFGASVGREGAALQLGGGIATLVSRVLHLDDPDRHILVHCGMAALFSALFGTPLAAFFFALEVACVGRISKKAILPTFIASLSAYGTAVILGSEPERFEIGVVPELGPLTVGITAVIAIFGAVLSIALCFSLRYCTKFFKFAFKNGYIRACVGGVVLVLLTFAVGCRDYNGAGVDIIKQVFSHGEVKPEAFVLKLIFTSVAVASGYKGGEIIPTLFIGATFGGTVALLLGISPALGAAVGMTALFCGVTNCPFASLFLSVELFSGEGFVFMLIAVIISFVISGRISLYSAQKVTGFKDLINTAKSVNK